MRPRIVEFFGRVVPPDLALILVPTGTTLYVLAMLVVMVLYVKRCEKSGLSAYHALGSCIYGMIAGLVGARVFYLAETLGTSLQNPGVFLDVFGGTTSWGAYIGGLLGFFGYLRAYRLPTLSYADIFGASLGLGPCIGRWSCFLNGCCYGTPSDLRWSVSYPAGSPPFWSQVQQGVISADASLSLPLHPFQIYLSVSACVVFLLVSTFAGDVHAGWSVRFGTASRRSSRR